MTLMLCGTEASDSTLRLQFWQTLCTLQIFILYCTGNTSTVLAGYHTLRSAATRYWLGQCSWTCCWSFTMEGVDSWCMILMMMIVLGLAEGNGSLPLGL